MTCKNPTTLKNWAPQFCGNKTTKTSKCGGECLKFRCYITSSQSVIGYSITISTIENTDIQQGQIYALNIDKNNYVDYAFLCRSAVINNKVYLKIYDDKDVLPNTPTYTITITNNKCDYDVRVVVPPPNN
jgi:hypothetical protein